MTVLLNQIVYSRRRLFAWLGIGAILMLFIAPVVSNMLVAQGMPMPMMADMTLSPEVPETSEMTMSSEMTLSSAMPQTSEMSTSSDAAKMAAMPMPDHVMPTHPAAASPPASTLTSLSSTSAPANTLSPDEMMGVACGYCVLLMHLPLLVLLAVALIWSLSVVVRPLFSRITPCLLSSPTLTDSQPRAPPASLLFAFI